MKMKKKLMAALLTVGVAIPAGSAGLTGTAIMEKIDNRPDGNDRQTVMEMTLVNRRGRKRVRAMVVYSKDYGKDTKSIFYFRKPADVKGVGFLTWGYDNPARDDDRWLYLPALKRSKRISGSSKNDYFMGSDLTYDDMGNRSVSEDVHTLLREETVDGHACWVVQSVPKDKSYMYSKVVSTIRKDALITIKADFYDRHGALLKTMVKSDIRKHQGFWTAFLTKVENVQERHQTILKIEKMKYNRGLKNSLFRATTLERGRLK